MQSAVQENKGLEAGILPEDMLRADMYGFLANLLRGEPSNELLKTVASIQGDPSAIGSATSVLATLASKLSGDEIRDEYMRYALQTLLQGTKGCAWCRRHHD